MILYDMMAKVKIGEWDVHAPPGFHNFQLISAFHTSFLPTSAFSVAWQLNSFLFYNPKPNNTLGQLCVCDRGPDVGSS